VLAGLATSGFFTATSLVISAVIVRAVTERGSGLLAVALLSLGTLLGACVGSWASQPLVTRFVMQRLR
jgi:hypothetical protein